MIYSFCSTDIQCGKTTCSEYMSRRNGGIIVEFSTPISIMAKVIYGYNGEKSDPKQRKILQDFGLACKSIDPYYWCWRVLICAYRDNKGMKFEDFIEPSVRDFKCWIEENSGNFVINKKDIIISGMRSPEEAEFFKRYGAKIILINRNKKESERNLHAVESQLSGYDGFDYVIDNNGSIEDLYKKIEIIIGDKK